MYRVDDLHTTLAVHTTAASFGDGVDPDAALTQVVHSATTEALRQVKKHMGDVARGRAVDVKGSTIVPIIRQANGEIRVTIIATVLYVQSAIVLDAAKG